MGFFFWTAGVPIILFAVAALLAFVTRSVEGLPIGVGAVALLWLGFTAKARRTYWNARVRSRAHADARRARSTRS